MELLEALQVTQIGNSISLITKTPLNDEILSHIQNIRGLRIIFFLSYSGLGRRFEPNFADRQFQENFQRVKEHGFSLVHYWRPLLPDNTSLAQIRNMLSFVSSVADASVIVGLKLHPELNNILTQDGSVSIPDSLMSVYGEWLDREVIERIYEEANRLCPNYPLYRHTSCALASVLSHPNHTATVFREDICPPSHCPVGQRAICKRARVIPSKVEITKAISKLGRTPPFKRLPRRVVINDIVSQEEFSFLLHTLNCPIEVTAIRYENIYKGSIHINQKDATGTGHA